MEFSFAYIHPVLAALSLGLAWVVFRQGFAQRTQRLRRIKAAEGSYVRHVALGPWSVCTFFVAFISGAASAVLVRGMKPMATLHGWLGAVSVVLFALLWWLGRRLARGDKSHPGRHGILGVVALLLGALTGVLGISLLP